MRVVICHERFLARFGADRVLLILARRLRQLGAHVTLMGGRFDESVLADAADARIVTPLDTAAPELEERTRDWLCREWTPGLGLDDAPDLVIVGGWPFFSAIPLFRAIAKRVLFIDCGVVPEEGYAAPQRALLRQLTMLRTRFLRDCTHIAANSRFTLESQSLPQAGPAVACAAVLNGIDHLADAPASASLPDALEAQLQAHQALILLLGRFEPVGYKDSGAAFQVMERVRLLYPSCGLLVLESPERLAVPPSLAPHVIGLGHPDDSTLMALMRRVDLGWSVSQWEGFNLPLAEMFWLGKPAVAFNLAAHPEVVPDPWFLAEDVSEMAAKTAWILRQVPVVPPLTDENLRAYRQRFTWDHFVEETIRLVGLDERLLPIFATSA